MKWFCKFSAVLFFCALLSACGVGTPVTAGPKDLTPVTGLVLSPGDEPPIGSGIAVSYPRENYEGIAN